MRDLPPSVAPGLTIVVGLAALVWGISKKGETGDGLILSGAFCLIVGLIGAWLMWKHSDDFDFRGPG